MSIGKTVWRVKYGVIGMLLVMGMASVAEPTVTVGEVKTGEPWSKVTVSYTLGGTDTKLEYKVAFAVTAGGQTASVTNDAAKLTDGAATQVIDTAALFGKQVSDTKAKVRVSLIAVKPKGVQLWENGPFWAECNVGATKPEEYGELYTFNDDKAKKAAESLGSGWRLPTRTELNALRRNCGTGKWTERNGVNGCLFTGKGDYSSKSIFLPAAGYTGYGVNRKEPGGESGYWSSTEEGVSSVWTLLIDEGDFSDVILVDRVFGMPVRAVR